MKTILAVVGGGKSDAAVFETAFGMAQRMTAHVECFHARIGSGEAALYIPHLCYAAGPALGNALAQLEIDAEARSTAALHHFHQTCAERGVSVADGPNAIHGPTAAWREENGDAVSRIVTRARFHDLVVAARPSGPNGLPSDLLDRLLFDGGRPVLVPPAENPTLQTDTIMVCWKNRPESARAVGCALPMLKRSPHVVVTTVSDDEAAAQLSLTALAANLAWHGISAETRWIPGADASAADRLDEAAAACGAGLIVMGAYGRSRMRELILGGCTQRFIERATCAVFFAH